MRPIELKKDIYWVGGIDWDLRSFHGYLTQRGSTYNAYLIMDEKIILIDTVRPSALEIEGGRLREIYVEGMQARPVEDRAEVPALP